MGTNSDLRRVVEVGRILYSGEEVRRLKCVIWAVTVVLLAVAGRPAGVRAAQTISRAEYVDKLRGGWLGQMAGVAWGYPVEFAYRGRMVPEEQVPTWTPSRINNGYSESIADDVHVEIPFLDALNDNGVYTDGETFGEYFRDTSFQLWHANWQGRTNLRNGVGAPWSGHYSVNEHADDIDWEIEADFVGMIAPGQPNVAADLAWRAGHVMNYGDGVYGGVFVAAMHAKAFFSRDIDQIIESGRQAIPLGSEFREVIDDVIAWKSQGMTFEQNWQALENKWGKDDNHCPEGRNRDFNIDAKLHAGYIVIGLLYGEGDFEQSMRYTMRCGQDADSSTQNTGSILGNMLGFAAIESKWKSELETDRNFARTDYTFEEAIEVSVNLAREIVVATGGSITGAGESEVWHVPDSAAVAPLILERWPTGENSAPMVGVIGIKKNSRNVSFSVTATDANGVASYQWFFGDLSYASGQNVSHTYLAPGTYKVIAYATDTTGNTGWRETSVMVEDKGLALNVKALLRNYLVESDYEGTMMDGKVNMLDAAYLLGN